MIDVDRSQPPPESLAEGKGWRGEDVKARLRRDFLRKCYLCEGPLGRDFEVEHRHPRSVGGGDHDWNNLFPAHHPCNNGRPAYPTNGLLNPGEGLEQRLNQRLDQEDLPWFSSNDPNDVMAHNTAEELMHLHRGTTDAADDLRATIKHQWTNVLKLTCLLQALQLDGRGDSDEAREFAHELRCKVSRDAPYSALIRGALQKLNPRLLLSLR